MQTSLLDRLVTQACDLISIPSTESRPEERARCLELCRQRLETVEGVQIRDYESRGFASLVAVPPMA